MNELNICKIIIIIKNNPKEIKYFKALIIKRSDFNLTEYLVYKPTII